jgi:hypothetical protein
MAMDVFAQITKVDEEKRLVFGRAVDEAPDRSGEVFDYVTSKPYFEAWSAETKEASDGKSVGNLRAMHGKVAAGRLVDMQFNDTDRAIDVVAHVVDNNEWEKVLTGTYTGFSIGGSYVKKWDDAASKADDGKAPYKRYTAAPNELSLVDRPCIPTAKFFEVRKRDGTSEQVEFHPAYTEEDIEAKARELCKTEEMDPDAPVMGETAPTWKRFTRRAENILQKRDFSEKSREKLADSGKAMPGGGFPIVNASDLENAIKAIGRAKNPEEAKAHIVSRAKALGATHLLPPDWEGSTKEEKAAMSEMKKGGDGEGKTIDDCNDEGWSESEMEDLHDSLGSGADEEDKKTLDTAKRHLKDNHVLMAKGDFPGHPFRGNQWKSGDSGKAVDKSMRAHGHETKGAHSAAAAAHSKAAASAKKSGHSVTAAYHEKMAAFHTSRAGKMSKAEEATALAKESVAEGGHNGEDEGTNSLPKNAATRGGHDGVDNNTALNAAAMKDLHAKLAEYASMEQQEFLNRAKEHLQSHETPPTKGDKAAMAKGDVMTAVNTSKVSQDAILASRSTLSTPKDVPAHNKAAVAHGAAAEHMRKAGEEELAAYHEAMAAFHRTYMDKAAGPTEYEVEGTDAEVSKLAEVMHTEKLAMRDVLAAVDATLAARKGEAARANEEAAIKRLESEGKLKKGMYTVGRLAAVVQQLDDIRTSVNEEEKFEGDAASGLPTRMLDLVGLATDVLRDMVIEETNELLPQDGVDVDTMEAGSAPKIMAMADHFGALRKVGARNSSADQARIQKVHDLCVELGGACSEKPAATETPAAEATDKVEPANDLLKNQIGEMQKVLERFTKMEEDNKALLEKVAKLESEPRAAKGVLRAINKSQDTGTGEDPAAPEIQPVMKGGVVQEAATDIKKVLQGGGKPFLSATSR